MFLVSFYPFVVTLRPVKQELYFLAALLLCCYVCRPVCAKGKIALFGRGCGPIMQLCKVGQQ